MIIKIIFQQTARGLWCGRWTDWLLILGNSIAGMLFRWLRRDRLFGQCESRIGGMKYFQAGATAYMSVGHAQLCRCQSESGLTVGALRDQQFAHGVTGSFSQ